MPTMFINPCCYSNFSSFSLVSSIIQPRCSRISPAMCWIAFGKLPENPVITPSTSKQVVRATAPNRFLETVTVLPESTTTGA